MDMEMEKATVFEPTNTCSDGNFTGADTTELRKAEYGITVTLETTNTCSKGGSTCTDSSESKKAESNLTSQATIATQSIKDSNSPSTTLGTVTAELSQTISSECAKSPGDEATDPSRTRNTTAEENQNSNKEYISGSSTKDKDGRTVNNLSLGVLVAEVSKRINTNDNQQDTAKESSNESSESTKRRRSPRKIHSDQTETGSKPKRQRKCATEASYNQSTSTGPQERPSKDIDAEWSLDERRILLEALESDNGKRYWNAIANKVKTKNVNQVKHYTEILRAQANDTTPVHLVGGKDGPLQEWISVCERLRGGQDDMDAKCIPQVMTIAAVEPTSSQESSAGPNYSRIYTFLSCVLRGQNAVGLTPIDAKVILELLQSLEIKVMHADLVDQQSFLKSRYGITVKELEQEQLISAMEELQKEAMNREVTEAHDSTSCDGDTRHLNSGDKGEEGIRPGVGHTLAGGQMSLMDNQRDIMFETSKSLSSSSDSIAKATGSKVTRTEKTSTSNSTADEETPVSLMDSQTDERSDTSKSLQSHSSTIAGVTSSNKTRMKRSSTSTPLDKSLQRITEKLRKKRLRMLKGDRKKPQLSSLNPVCVPVSLLNMKPKTHPPH